MKKVSILLMVILLAAGTSLLIEGSQAKSKVLLYGTVTDQAGLPLTAVTIIAEEISSGSVHRIISDSKGEFEFSNIPPGIYDLHFELTGFKAALVKGVKVLMQRRIELTAVLVSVKAGTKSLVKMRPIVTGDVKMQEVRELEGVRGGVIGGVSKMSIARDAAAPSAYYPEFNTEEYNRIYETGYLTALTNPLSTFSIDVDTASYANLRRFLKVNEEPPKDAVRIEEMINYFQYDYPQPNGKHPFSVYTEISSAPWNPNHRLVHIGLQGKVLETEELPPSNLVFLLDVSGSMNSANKLPLLKSAFQILTKQMRKEDRVAIVVYAGAAGLVLPSTTGDLKQRILDAIEKLQAGGSTAGGAGIQLAYKVAKENFIKDGNNRIILATDGDFNIGTSSTSELIRLIEEKREQGIFLTILGFGMGNYKDGRMEQLADKGNGNYYYIDGLLEAKKVFMDDMRGTLFTIAKDVKIQIEFNPAKVKGYRLIGYENRMLKKEDFADDKKDAGELGAGHTVTALYEIIPYGSKEEIPGSDKLKYQDTKISSEAFKSKELLTVKLRYKAPDGDTSKLIVHPLIDRSVRLAQASNNFKFSSAVAQFGLLLRDSEFKGSASLDSVLEMAKEAKGADNHGYRAEFINLVELSKLLDQLK
ncbi:von Willebrand factor type A domain-containing protein [Acidobacteriota bacterium]